MAARLALPFVLALALAGPAAAQMETREGIALQNQILQLRQEIEQLRRSGGGGGFVAPPVAPGRPGFPPGGGGELVPQLLDRVNNLEEEVRRLRGRNDVLENQNRRLQQDVEKLQGDLDFRFSQLEGRGGAAPAPQRPPAPVPPVARPDAPAAPTAPTPPAAAGPRPPERAIAEGQAALGRRDFAAAEAAAREALASRSGAQQVAGQILLGDALAGRRDFGNAAIAYNEAYTRARTGPRAPEALVGLANAFIGLNERRTACDTLADLRSQFPNLSGPLAERAQQARQRAGCR
jgi:TolA-binding protein